MYPLKGGGDASSSERSGDESLPDGLKAEAADVAAKQRKRAGLPELQLDQLPSTISQKVMKLV